MKGRLVLSRYPGEKIVIGDGEIIVTVVEVRGGKVRLGVEAPQQISIMREELLDESQQSK